MWIIGLLSSVAFMTFKTAKNEDLLRAGALRLVDVLREAQSLGQSGGSTTSAWSAARTFGVHVVKAAQGTSGNAIVFADTDGASGIGKWDEGKDAAIRTVSFDVDSRQSVTLNTITIGDDATPTAVDVSFTLPTGIARIDGKNASNDPKAAVFTFRHAAARSEKPVTFQRVTGRIDIEY